MSDSLRSCKTLSNLPNYNLSLNFIKSDVLRSLDVKFLRNLFWKGYSQRRVTFRRLSYCYQFVRHCEGNW